MKATSQIIFYSFVIVLLACQCTTASEDEGAKEFSKKKIERWYKHLENSPEKIYDNFGDEKFNITLFKEKIEDSNHHLKVYMGKNGDEYCLFVLICKGELVAGGYSNIYDTIYRYKDSEFVLSSKDTLSSYIDEWAEDYPEKHKAKFVKAFIIPNDDINDLFEKTEAPHYAHFSFGMKNKLLQKNQVKLILSNGPKVQVNFSELEVGAGSSVYLDLSCPCPEICADNEPLN